MVGVTLGTIEIGVHLIAFEELHEVLLNVKRIRVAVISFHNTAILHVGIVAHSDRLHHLAIGGNPGRLLQHLLQGGKGIEHSIGMLAQNNNIGLPLSRAADAKHMTVKLVLNSKYIPGHSTLDSPLVSSALRAVDAEPQVAASYLRLPGQCHGNAVLLSQHLL